MKIWKVEIKPGHFSANALALLLVTLGALLLADYGYEAGSMLRLAVVAVITTILSVLAFRYSQQDIPGLVVSWAVIICAMVVLMVGWMAYTYESPFPIDTAISYVIGPLSLIIFYVVFLYAAFFVYHNFVEEEKEEVSAVSPLISRVGQAAQAAAQKRAAEPAKETKSAPAKVEKPKTRAAPKAKKAEKKSAPAKKMNTSAKKKASASRRKKTPKK